MPNFESGKFEIPPEIRPKEVEREEAEEKEEKERRGFMQAEMVGEADYYMTEYYSDYNRRKEILPKLLDVESKNLRLGAFRKGEREYYPDNEEEKKKFIDSLEVLRDGIDKEDSRKAKEILEKEVESFNKKIRPEGKGFFGTPGDQYLTKLRGEILELGKETKADEKGTNPEVEDRLTKMRGFMDAAVEDKNSYAAFTAFKDFYRIQREHGAGRVEYTRTSESIWWEDPNTMANYKTYDEIIPMERDLNKIEKIERNPSRLEDIKKIQRVIEFAKEKRRKMR